MSDGKIREAFEQFIILRDGSIWVTVLGDKRSYSEPIERDFAVWCESRAAQANVSLADEGEMPADQTQVDIITFPRELSDDLGELIAEKARVCGGGAFEIWETICEQFGTPAEQPAPVAVAYQYRQRPLWRKDDNSGWMPWQDCSQEAHADYTASHDLHDWQYETRTLYAGPNQQ